MHPIPRLDTASCLPSTSHRVIGGSRNAQTSGQQTHKPAPSSVQDTDIIHIRPLVVTLTGRHRIENLSCPRALVLNPMQSHRPIRSRRKSILSVHESSDGHPSYYLDDAHGQSHGHKYILVCRVLCRYLVRAYLTCLLYMYRRLWCTETGQIFL